MTTEARGPSVEEAVEVALAELGATEQEVRIEVVQEPKAGSWAWAARRPLSGCG